MEINTREHFSVHGFKDIPFAVSSRWYERKCTIPTYELSELLGTKLRALYQRKKGRDLFDIDLALKHPEADANRILEAYMAYMAYMAHEDHETTRALFEENLHRKLSDAAFTADIGPLLASGYEWNIETAVDAVSSQLIGQLPGEPWKGEE